MNGKILGLLAIVTLIITFEEGPCFCMTSGLPTDAEIRAQVNKAETLEKQGKNDEAKKARQKAADMVDAKYPVGSPAVNGEPAYTPTCPSDGLAFPGAGNVQLGPSGFKSGGVNAPANAPFSPSFLAGVKLHEATHCEQFRSGTWKNEPVNRDWHEILASVPVLGKADELGLSKAERDEFLRRMKNDLGWMKIHIRDWTAETWQKEKGEGNIPLSNEYVNLYEKMKRIIRLEQEGNEIGALRWKLEYKKEVEEQLKTAQGTSKARLEEANKSIDLLIKAEELVEKYAMMNNIRDAKDNLEGLEAAGMDTLLEYSKNIVKLELENKPEDALKMKKELLEKMRKAADGKTGKPAEDLSKAKAELERLIQKETLVIGTPESTTPVTSEAKVEAKTSVIVAYHSNGISLPGPNDYMSFINKGPWGSTLQPISTASGMSAKCIHNIDQTFGLGIGYRSMNAKAAGKVAGIDQAMICSAYGFSLIATANIPWDIGPLDTSCFAEIGNYTGYFEYTEPPPSKGTGSAIGYTIGAGAQWHLTDLVGLYADVSYLSLNITDIKDSSGNTLVYWPTGYDVPVKLDFSGAEVNIGVALTL